VSYAWPYQNAADLRGDERLLAAAKSDNESLLESVIEELQDINYVDGYVAAQGCWICRELG
jgi:hypothetical protein